jgi:hypothetical protein
MVWTVQHGFWLKNSQKRPTPSPLGFQHAQYCGECVAGSSCGVWCAVLLFCMLNSARAFLFVTTPIRGRGAGIKVLNEKVLKKRRTPILSP